MQTIERAHNLQQVFEHLQNLPPVDQSHVCEFIEFLYSKNNFSVEKQRKQPHKKRQAGSLKGQIVLADDFDEPLEDFKDYM